MRLGVMGGTFDPIHLGHLAAASEICFRLELDRVIFVPTGQSWHKDRAEASPADIRLEMAIAATANDARFTVSRVDVDREGPTYTVDTLDDLRRHVEHSAPGTSIQWFFITGADALATLGDWKDPSGIAERATIIGVTRPGHQLADPGIRDVPVQLVQVPGMAISSTEIRDRIAEGAPIRYLVPDSVEEIIRERGLYRAR